MYHCNFSCSNVLLYLWCYTILPDEENWRNENPPMKVVTKSRRAIHSMLNPTVELTRSLMILRNGHLSIAKESIHTTHTCAFDSAFTVIAAMYADCTQVKSQIDCIEPINILVKMDLIEPSLVLMVKSMFGTQKTAGVVQNTLLRLRNQLLMNIFEGTQRMKVFSGLTTINCSCNVNYLIPKMLPTDLYSYVRKKECDQCEFELISKRCFVDIDFRQFQLLSIQNLNECLVDCLISDSSTNCSCGGTLTASHTEFSNFIIIDLTVENVVTAITLQDIPKTLNILDIAFKLFGCIEFIGEDKVPIAYNDDEDEGIGHYVSHIWRSGRWERYDDLRNKITKSKTSLKIKAQVLFYVKD